MKVNNRMGKLARRVFLYSALVFIIGFSSSGSTAQRPEVLSRKPPVIKVFNPETGESTIETPLDEALQAYQAYEEMVHQGSISQPPLRLNRAGYSYPGREPTRPKAVTFTFTPREKRNGVVHFLISADNTIVQEGEVSVLQENKSRHQELQVAVPTDIFLRIVQTKKVEFKISTQTQKTSYKLNDYQKKCVTALASTIK